jgi:cytochrome c biogenesis protein CcmG, thiol:disulfide interchange protein DsbE
MTMFRFVRASAVAGLLLAGLSSIAVAAPNVGDSAPALTVPELNGRYFDLAALRGKTVIVNFWATWCAPCRLEMPRFDAFYRHYHDQGVELIGVSADRSRDRDDVQKVMAGFSYPAAMLSDAKSNGFGPPAVLPITYVIGPDGTVRAKLVPTDDSGISEKELDDAVLPLVQGNGPRDPAAATLNVPGMH